MQLNVLDLFWVDTFNTVLCTHNKCKWLEHIDILSFHLIIIFLQSIFTKCSNNKRDEKLLSFKKKVKTKHENVSVWLISSIWKIVEVLCYSKKCKLTVGI